MAFVEQVGKQWRGRYRDAEGKRRTAGMSPSKKEAMRLALEEERKIRQGDWTNPDGAKMTFTQYFEEHWRALPSPRRTPPAT